jgi:hypothetical protein
MANSAIMFTAQPSTFHRSFNNYSVTEALGMRAFNSQAGSPEGPESGAKKKEIAKNKEDAANRMILKICCSLHVV